MQLSISSISQPHKLDEESEPLSTSNSTYESIENKSTSSTASWKKYAISGAVVLLAIVSYTAFSTTHHTPINSTNIDLDNVNLLSKHLDGQDLMSHGHPSKSGKDGSGENKKLTKAEMNTKLFDDQREFGF